jgi:hypothetical protein
MPATLNGAVDISRTFSVEQTEAILIPAAEEVGGWGT